MTLTDSANERARAAERHRRLVSFVSVSAVLISPFFNDLGSSTFSSRMSCRQLQTRRSNAVERGRSRQSNVVGDVKLNNEAGAPWCGESDCTSPRRSATQRTIGP